MKLTPHQIVYTITSDIRYSRSKRVHFLTAQGNRVVSLNELVSQILVTDHKPGPQGLLVKESELPHLQRRLERHVFGWNSNDRLVFMELS